MTFSFHSVLFLLSTFNGLIFAGIAFFRVKKSRNNFYLGSLMLMLTVMFFDEFSRWTPDFFINYPQFTFIFTFVWFLFIPTIFLLVRFQVSGVIFKWWDIVHLIPVILMNYFDNQFIADLELRKTSLLSHIELPEAHFGKFFFSSQIIIYLFWTYFLLKRRFKYQGVELYSRLRGWLKAIFVTFLLYLLSVVIFISAYEVWDVYLKDLDIWKTNLFLIVMYGWLFYTIFQPNYLENPIRSIRIWRDKFDQIDGSSELQRIIEKMKGLKPYLSQNIGTGELAEQLGIKGRKLADIVNSELNVSVPQFINVFRIKEMEERYFEDEFKKMSIEGMAKEVGFRNKSSFYRSFKEFTGETPSTYFDRLIKED